MEGCLQGRYIVSRLEVWRMGGAVICSYANADAYDAVDLIDEHGGRLKMREFVRKSSL